MYVQYYMNNFSLTKDIQFNFNTVDALVFEAFQIQVVVFGSQFRNRQNARKMVTGFFYRLVELRQIVIGIGPKHFMVCKI